MPTTFTSLPLKTHPHVFVLPSSYTPQTYTHIKHFITHIFASSHSCFYSLKCCSVLAVVCNQENTWRQHKPRMPRVGGRSWLCQEQGQGSQCGNFRLEFKALRGRQDKWRYRNVQQAKAIEHSNQEKASSTVSPFSGIREFWFHELGSWSWWD